MRDECLYRQEFPTFEAYCRERWGLSRTYAHYLVDAAAVVDILAVHNCEHSPATESQARELARLRTPEGRRGDQRAADRRHPGLAAHPHRGDNGPSGTVGLMNQLGPARRAGRYLAGRRAGASRPEVTTMELTENQQKQFTLWLQSTGILEKRCPGCGEIAWQGARPAALVEASLNGEFWTVRSESPAILPVVALVCGKCRLVLTYSMERDGPFPPPS